MRRVLALFIVSFVMATPASAHERVVLDPDDSIGPLDIVAARLQHDRSNYVLRVVTYEEWADSTISDELDYVRFDLLSASGKPKSRCVVVRLQPPQGQEPGPVVIEGTVYRDCHAPLPYHEPIGSIESATRPDSHSLEVTVSRKMLWKRAPETIRWKAYTSYEDENYEGCEPPDQLPPEHFFGTCSDETEYKRH